MGLGASLQMTPADLAKLLLLLSSAAHLPSWLLLTCKQGNAAAWLLVVRCVPCDRAAAVHCSWQLLLPLLYRLVPKWHCCERSSMGEL
jgi:hypothetical protein